LLDYDPCCLGLADSEEKRAESYAAWVKETIAPEESDLICNSLQRGRLTGSPGITWNVNPSPITSRAFPGIDALQAPDLEGYPTGFPPAACYGEVHSMKSLLTSPD